MKISEASDFFKSLITQTNSKSELKVYQRFINILINLNNRDLSEQQLNSIEKKLDSLNLSANSENRKKYLKRKLTEFTNYVKKELSLITEGHYTALGISLGTSFGVTFGVVYHSISYGIIFGMLLGLIIGAVMDSKAKKQNRVLM